MTASDAQEALIKTVEPIRVACMKRTDARNAVTEVGAEVLTQLSEEVARAGLEQDGPIHLLCTDCRHERRPLCVFEWCIPIANNPHPLSLTHGAILRTLHSFRCVTGTHRGSYDGALARAVGRLAMIAELPVPLVRVGGLVMLTKGQKGDEEWEEAGATLHDIFMTLAGDSGDKKEIQRRPVMEAAE